MNQTDVENPSDQIHNVKQQMKQPKTTAQTTIKQTEAHIPSDDETNESQNPKATMTQTNLKTRTNNEINSSQTSMRTWNKRNPKI